MNNEVDKKIGENIRKIRMSRGLTLTALADKYTEVSGDVISNSLIGAWERNEKRISASQLIHIAEALDCTVNLIYGYKPEKSLESILAKIYKFFANLPKEEIRAVNYSVNDWEGNSHALIQCVAMYTSMNKKDRSDVAFVCLHQYEEAQAAGRLLPNAPNVDSKFIEKEWIRLLKKEKK